MAGKLRLILYSGLCSLMILSGCMQVPNHKPKIESIKNIANLSTIKAYFHNVAVLNKEAGKGFTHWGEIDREYWIPYTGVVTYGVDFSEVGLKEEDGTYIVTIPSAEVQGINIDTSDPYTFSDKNTAKTDDSWNKNEFTPEEQAKGLADAQELMKLEAWQNEVMMQTAQNRAGALIQGYIESLGEASETEYSVELKYKDNVIPENIQKQIDEAAKNKS